MSQQRSVVTVTLNPAIDQTISIPNFTVGKVNRVVCSRVDAGGKGINVASFLADYGHRATVTGFLGSDNDEIFRRLFERKNIEDRCIRIVGMTRTGLKITDEELLQTTDINFPGEAPSENDLARLFDVLTELSRDHEWFVLSGSIPRGAPVNVFAEMVRRLKGEGPPHARKVLLDTSGEGFRHAVEVGPDLIKPNLDELREFTGDPLESPAAILAAARGICSRYGVTSVVVSMGQEGAIFVEGDESVWAAPPAVQVRSTVGAGDAMVAGLVAGKIRGLSLPDCARLATAFASVAVTQVERGLPSCAGVDLAARQVSLREVPDA